jgi:penicillin-binding protein 2
MESGKVTERTSYNCSASLFIGDRYFNNHNKSGEGMMNVITAIKRSCNTWMYQAALAVGADPITDMAMRMGFGEKTGIPIKAEAAGNLPTNARKLEQRGTKIIGGELANISIGQGEVLATPLQVCQSMAALADGVNLVQPRLVLQVQDVNDQVVMATEVQVRRRIDLNPEQRDAVVKGMVAVVSGSGGTGKAAGIKHAQIAGKTGTAQWKPSQRQNLAWFTGFLPANNPVYAFAVLYEGRPGESVSGGKLAAPMVREVFNNVFEKASSDDPLVLAMKDTDKFVEVDEGGLDAGSGDDGDTPPPSARPVEEVKAAQPVEEKKTFKGFFKKLFNK